MRTVYLANVGTRDITVEGNYLKNPRTEGEQLLSEYNNICQRLDAPILIPGLRYALNMVEKVEKVFLFVSDQDEVVEDRFREKDTVYLGKILKLLLKETFLDRVKETWTIRIQGNPADYNQMNSFFAKRLNELSKPEEWEFVFTAPVGGADASNMALLLNTVRRFKEHCQLIYVMPNGEILPLDLGRQIIMEYSRQKAISHLKQHDYGALVQLLQDDHQLFPPWVEPIARYASARLHFDFEAADQCLIEAMAKAFGQINLNIITLKESLSPFLSGVNSPITEKHWAWWLSLHQRLMAELFFNLKLKYERGEFVDFMGRLFRLHEAVLRYIFEVNTHLLTDNEKRFKEEIEKNNTFITLKEYLDRKNLRYEPNTMVLRALLDFWVREGGKGKEYGKVSNYLNQLEQLSVLRHKSIIAHGYQGISKNQIEEKWAKEESVTEGIEKMLRYLGIDLGNDPFNKVNLILKEVFEGEISG